MKRALGEIRLQNPIRGRWGLPNYPDAIECNGRRFNRTSWAWPYENVVAQYREARQSGSLHMLAFADGTFLIDHVDAQNPDFDPVGHAIEDTDLGPLLGIGLLVFGGLALLSALDA